MGRIQSVDGLRGIGIFVVLVYHLRVGYFPSAWVAMSTFFALSGTLMTFQMLNVHGKKGVEGISVFGFWARRVSRLFPLLFLVVAAILLYTEIATRTTSEESRYMLRRDLLSALGYCENFNLMRRDQDYFAHLEGPSVVRHIWSLSIEEQYYFAWPLIFVSVGKGWLSVSKWSFTKNLIASPHGSDEEATIHKRGFAMFLACFEVMAMIISQFVGAYVFETYGASTAYFATWTRAGEFAVGGLVACSLSFYPQMHTRLFGSEAEAKALPPLSATQRVCLELGCGIGVSTLLGCCMIPLPMEELLRRYFHWMRMPLVITITFGCVLCSALQLTQLPLPPWAIFTKFFIFRPMTFLGEISYGLYLIHWPLICWFGHPDTLHSPTVRDVVISVSSIALATLSFFAFEIPTMSYANSKLAPTTTIKTGFASAFLIALMVIAGTSSRPSSALWPYDSNPLNNLPPSSPLMVDTPIFDSVEAQDQFSPFFDSVGSSRVPDYFATAHAASSSLDSPPIVEGAGPRAQDYVTHARPPAPATTQVETQTSGQSERDQGVAKTQEDPLPTPASTQLVDRTVDGTEHSLKSSTLDATPRLPLTASTAKSSVAAAPGLLDTPAESKHTPVSSSSSAGTVDSSLPKEWPPAPPPQEPPAPKNHPPPPHTALDDTLSPVADSLRDAASGEDFRTRPKSVGSTAAATADAADPAIGGLHFSSSHEKSPSHHHTNGGRAQAAPRATKNATAPSLLAPPTSQALWSSQGDGYQPPPPPPAAHPRGNDLMLFLGDSQSSGQAKLMLQVNDEIKLKMEHHECDRHRSEKGPPHKSRALSIDSRTRAPAQQTLLAAGERLKRTRRRRRRRRLQAGGSGGQQHQQHQQPQQQQQHGSHAPPSGPNVFHHQCVPVWHDFCVPGRASEHPNWCTKNMKGRTYPLLSLPPLVSLVDGTNQGEAVVRYFANSSCSLRDTPLKHDEQDMEASKKAEESLRLKDLRLAKIADTRARFVFLQEGEFMKPWLVKGADGSTAYHFLDRDMGQALENFFGFLADHGTEHVFLAPTSPLADFSPAPKMDTRPSFGGGGEELPVSPTLEENLVEQKVMYQRLSSRQVSAFKAVVERLRCRSDDGKASSRQQQQQQLSVSILHYHKLLCPTYDELKDYSKSFHVNERDRCPNSAHGFSKLLADQYHYGQTPDLAPAAYWLASQVQDLLGIGASEAGAGVEEGDAQSGGGLEEACMRELGPCRRAFIRPDWTRPLRSLVDTATICLG